MTLTAGRFVNLLLIYCGRRQRGDDSCAWTVASICPLLSAGVPSSPRNVISVVNKTSVILEWHPPRETGGRGDVVYNIVCKKCRADRRACSHCDDDVDFIPRQLGLTESRVLISNLLAHTLYSFEIQAVNGVSNKSPYPAQHVSIDIITNQAGKWGPVEYRVDSPAKIQMIACERLQALSSCF